MKIYHERLNRDFESSDSNKKIQEVYERMLNPMLDEDATADAYKTLKAIMGAVKGSKDYRKNSIYHMSRGMMDSYKKNKGFSKDQAKWIYNISKAMFKKK